MKILAFLFGVLLLLSGCAGHVLSEAALENVDPAVEFAEVKANPEAHRGQTLILGGKILQNRLSGKASTLEILRYVLDRAGYPQAADEIGGRFLVRSDRFLDPEIYRKERFVTLTGTVLGEETRKLDGEDGIEYAYPVFSLGEIHLWQHTYPLRYYPYDYYYDPYWPFYDPFYPYLRPYPFWRSYPRYWW